MAACTPVGFRVHEAGCGVQASGMAACTPAGFRLQGACSRVQGAGMEDFRLQSSCRLKPQPPNAMSSMTQGLVFISSTMQGLGFM